jgi:hypothetical protein
VSFLVRFFLVEKMKKKEKNYGMVMPEKRTGMTA